MTNEYWRCPSCGHEANGLPVTPRTVSYYCGKCNAWEDLKEMGKLNPAPKEKKKREPRKKKGKV